MLKLRASTDAAYFLPLQADYGPVHTERVLLLKTRDSGGEKN